MIEAWGPCKNNEHLDCLGVWKDLLCRCPCHENRWQWLLYVIGWKKVSA